jgi:hypothetical protein
MATLFWPTLFPLFYDGFPPAQMRRPSARSVSAPQKKSYGFPFARSTLGVREVVVRRIPETLV